MCRAIEVLGDDHVRVRFEVPDTTEWLQISILSPDAPGPVFKRTSNCAVRYQGSLQALTPDRRAEVGALVLAVARAAEARMAERPGATVAEAFGRRGGAGRVVFGRDALRDMLSPDVVEGVEIVDGWALSDVYPTSYLRDRAGASLDLLLDFRRASDGRRLLIEVARRNDDAPAFARTAHFNLSQLTLGAAELSGADTLRAVVSFVLQLRDHAALEVVFPDATEDLAPALLPEHASAAPGEALNLAINSACGQSCTFCSIQDTSPAEDGGDLVYARISADLESNRARGVLRVRINGYDPLSYSRILDVLRRASALGYETADVFSPCTLLADAAFCDEVVAALPPAGTFSVPIYAANAEAHDRVVGRPGAHALVLAALDNLAARVGPARIALLGVATRENLAELEGIARFAEARGLRFSVHMPYPSFESKADRYHEIAPRQRDVAARVAAAHRAGVRLFVEGIAPCVLFEAMDEAGVDPLVWLREEEGIQPLPGTEYRDPRFRHRAAPAGHAAFHAATIDCPHAAHCALKPVCPGEVLRSYAERYGIDEIAPVSIGRLIRAARATGAAHPPLDEAQGPAGRGATS